MRLSAAYITKDSKALLKRSLKSVIPFVDETIVYDTGSTDGSQDAAAAVGATVIQGEWRDDFGWARNQAFSHTTGDWVLTMDTDYVVLQHTWSTVRAVIQEPKVASALLWVSDAKIQSAPPLAVMRGKQRIGKARAMQLLFRGIERDSIYNGIIHECPTEWVNRRKLEGYSSVALDKADIVHYGYDRELYDAAGKGDRNMRLLLRASELQPDNPVPLSYLALVYAEDPSEEGKTKAVEVIDRAWKLREKLDGGAHLLRLVVARAKLGFRANDILYAWDALREWDRLGEQEHPDVLALKGAVCEAMWRGQDAKVFYERSLKVPYGCMRFIVSPVAEDGLRRLG